MESMEKMEQKMEDWRLVCVHVMIRVRFHFSSPASRDWIVA